MTQSATSIGRTPWRLRRWIAACAAGAVLALLAVAAVVYNTPCEWEDGSTNLACYWDADSQGNRQGRDVISVGYGRLVVTLG